MYQSGDLGGVVKDVDFVPVLDLNPKEIVFLRVLNIHGTYLRQIKMSIHALLLFER